MSAHTAGPWEVLDFTTGINGFFAVVSSGPLGKEHICDVFPFGNRAGAIKRELERHKANARLITAAPDLLAAILNSDDAHWTPAMRAAIAKATGAP